VVKRFLASYSSVDNSVCRHILIHGWPLCFCWYTYLIVLVLLCLFCLSLYSLLPDLWWMKLFKRPRRKSFGKNKRPQIWYNLVSNEDSMHHSEKRWCITRNVDSETTGVTSDYLHSTPIRASITMRFHTDNIVVPHDHCENKVR